MFRINLLPKEVKKKEPIRLPFLGILITVVGLILLLGEVILYFNLSSEVTNLRNENTSLETQYEEKLRLVDEISKREISWLDLFETLNRITPKNLWVKSFNLDSSDNINIEGFALNYKEIAIFLDQLDKSDLVKNVSLGFAQKVGEPPLVSINFRIVAQYKRGEQ